MLHIYDLKIGENSHDFFVEQANKSDFHDCYYILPSKFLITAMKKKANIQVGNFDSFVSELLKLEDTAGKQAISTLTRELLVEKVVRDLQKNKQLAYFNNTSVNASFVNSLITFISTLTVQAISCEDFVTLVEIKHSNENLPAGFFDKLYDLAKIYTLYSRYLVAMDEIDIFERYKMAAGILEQLDSGDLPWEKIYISDYYSLNQLELAIIRKLSQLTQVHMAVVYDKQRPQTFASLQTLRDTLVGFAGAQIFELPAAAPENNIFNFLCQNIYNIQAPQQDSSPAVIQAHGFYDKNQELQYIMADIKQKVLAGAPLSDFVLIVRDLNEYPHLSDFFLRAELPSSLPSIIHVHKHFLPRLLMDCLNLAAMPLTKTVLQNVLFSPLIVAYLGVDKDKLEKIFYEHEFDSFARLYNVLSELQEQQKLDLSPEIAALKKLEVLLQSICKRGRTEEFIQSLNYLLAELQVLEYIGTSYKLASFDEQCLKTALEIYAAIQKVLHNLHSSLSLLYGENYELGVRKFSSYLSRALMDKTITLEQGNQNTVRVIEAADIQSNKTKNVYILGLNEGVFPKYKRDSWLISAGEMYNLQIVLNNELELSASEDAYFFASCLNMAGQTLTLSYLDNERVRKSKYLLELKRLLPNLSETSHRTLIAQTACEIYDKYTLGNFLAIKAQQQLEAPLPPTAVTWLENRLGANLDCLLSLPPNESLDIARIKDLQTALFSITQLEDYANCPFKYLVNYVWQPTVWKLSALDNTPLTKGSFLHKVTEEFVRQYLGKSLPELVTARRELAEIFARLAGSFRTENAYTWQLNQAGLLEILMNWLEQEYADIGTYQFAAVEWEFGADGQFKIANLPIMGKIDRIDSSPNGIRITDYKYKNIVKFKNFAENKDNLQIPVYMLAVHELLANAQSKQLRANYYSFVKAQASTYLDTAQEEQSLEAIRDNTRTVLDQLATKLQQGLFQPTSNLACEYCPYRSICRVLKSELTEEEESE